MFLAFDCCGYRTIGPLVLGCSGSITSQGKSELVLLISFNCYYMVSVMRGFLFLVLGICYDIFCGTLDLLCNYFAMETMQSHITEID